MSVTVSLAMVFFLRVIPILIIVLRRVILFFAVGKKTYSATGNSANMHQFLQGQFMRCLMKY